jgi:hypothetical protein
MKRVAVNLLGVVVLLLICTQAARATSADHVFYVGTNQHVYDVSHLAGSTTLTTVDATADAGAGAQLASPSSTFASYFIDSEEFVYFETASGDLGLLYFYNGNWYFEDLTEKTGAPSPGGSTALLGFKISADAYIFYASDQQLIEIYSAGGNVWSWTSPSSLTGQYNALAGPASVAGFTIDSEELIYYINSLTGDVIELYNNGSGWTALNITTAAGAPPAALSGTYPSALTGFSYGLQSHVFFVGTNAHVYQLYENDGGAWSYTDLTANSGAPTVQDAWQLASFYYNSRFWLFYGAFYGAPGYMEVIPLYAAVNTDVWNSQALISVGDASSLLTGYDDTESNTAHVYCINGQYATEAYTAAASNSFTILTYESGQPLAPGNGVGGTFH